jgi:methionyl-tRNA formyltransferase
MDRLRVTQDRALRVILFGDGRWAADSVVRLHESPHRVVGVVVRAKPTDRALEDAAVFRGIPVLRPAQVNDAEATAGIAALGSDLNLSVAFDQIVRPPLLRSAPLGFVNFHAGKLPFYRGRNVLNWALINGETEIGLTAHFMDEGIDTGDILLQRTVPVGWTDTYGHVLDRVVAALPDLVWDTVQLLSTGTARPWAQAHLPGSYFGGRTEADEWLDWSDSSERLHNKVRAISRPAPGARTLLGNTMIRVWRAYYDPGWPRYLAVPGQVVGRREGEGVIVKTGDSTLLVREVQRLGGAPELPPWSIGTRLGIDGMSALQALLSRGAGQS